MSCRHSLGNVLGGVLPFLGGVLLGGVLAGGLLCFTLKTPAFGVGDPPASSFDAFLMWILFGLPPWTAIALIWQLAILVILWAVSPWPLMARPREALLLLGGIVSAIIAGVVMLGHKYGFSELPSAVIASVPVVIAPFLTVARDWNVYD